jgi:hypothetical protein
LSHILAAWVLACSAIFVLGCEVKPQIDLSGMRDSFLLSSRPEGATSLADAQNQLSENSDLVVKGWLDLNGTQQRKGNAVVLLREILADDGHGGAGHDPSSCPFCKRRMEAAPKAVVVFNNENGDPIPHQIDKLFAIKHGDLAVVTGRPASYDPKLKILTIAAKGLFLEGGKGY